MQFDLVVTENGTPEDREAIVRGLMAYNDGHVGPSGAKPLAILLRDPQGQTVGGLWGRSSYEWLVVELLFLPESLRSSRLGAELMGKAEAIARERGCIGMWLNTHSFQAPGFYKKLGFEVFGELDEPTRSSKRFFLRKVFSPA
jgi:GNAT superfamily N-acetyltransferase